MISDNEKRREIAARFPFLQNVTNEFVNQFFDAASLVQLPAGHLICQDGGECSLLPLVIQGTGRVYKLGENGREITLYRVEPGESCVVTASCILSGKPFPAFAECETDVEALVVRAPEVRRWMAECAPWREYVFALIAARLQEVFGVLDAVLFQRLDQRLINLLLQRSETRREDEVRMTHQTLAVELGSSREVVSRVLKALETQGMLRTERGLIRLLDKGALERRAREA